MRLVSPAPRGHRVNTYRYQNQQNLSPTELFFLIAADETRKQAGIDDVEAVILILSGLPILPTRAKPLGATQGTSVASVMARSVFRHEFKCKVLPTVTLQSIKNLRVILTHRLAVFVGRTVPGVGWVLLAKDAFHIVRNTVSRYNQIAKPEDRIL
ncbi:STM2901 family protein [Burkholderia lata]|uniref:STM2901 family protein n=1 Tax=Burkholderia lata (strain ATCC 17760 / DSM 23089 / LMG 22485 / NCIMB 9086 / R18194 / 383) TaxID=482957 RepID=UPI0015820B3C